MQQCQKSRVNLFLFIFLMVYPAPKNKTQTYAPYLLATIVTGVTVVTLYTKKNKQLIVVSKKQTAHYFDSKSSDAQLIREPVEWPVKLFYGIYGLRVIGAYCVSFLGRYATEKQALLKHSADPFLTNKQISHYLNFYKDFINMHEFVVPQEGFKTFNDWFIRSLKNAEKDRPLEKNLTAISSPADCKLLIIPNITLDTHITIKERVFNLETFLQDKELAQKYTHGTMMIFRLAPYDYHRYHYPIECTVSAETIIAGKYHSVNPRAFTAGVQPLTVNKRSYEILTPAGALKDKHISPIIMVQVGATAVASIVNHFTTLPKDTIFPKGSETGYFQFGGSTIVLLFQPGSIIPDTQITHNSLAGYETAVKARETIAYWK